LCGDPSIERVPGTTKGHKKCVPRGVYDLAAVVRKGRLEQPIVRVQDFPISPIAQALEQIG